jgi:hypothetical protein
MRWMPILRQAWTRFEFLIFFVYLRMEAHAGLALKA